MRQDSEETGNELERDGEWDQEMTAGRIRTRVPVGVQTRDAACATAPLTLVDTDAQTLFTFRSIWLQISPHRALISVRTCSAGP